MPSTKGPPKETKRLSRKGKLLLLILLVVLLLAALLLSLRVQTVQVTGNRFYTQEQIEELLFPKGMERNPLKIWLDQRLGRKKTIPFVEKYVISLSGLKDVEVTVYEKSMVGYVEFMGSYLYFDKDGMVVESSREKYGAIPQVAGLNVEYVVLNEPLPVKDPVIFKELLQISQYLASREVDWNGETRFLSELIERIYFDSTGNITCYLDEIGIFLGDGASLEGKLQEMGDIIPELSGQRGTLYLDSYDETVSEPSYIFRKSEG